MSPVPLRLLAALLGGGDWAGALGSKGTVGNLQAVTWVTGGGVLGVEGLKLNIQKMKIMASGPITSPSSCEGKLGVALESLQGPRNLT